MFLRPDKRVWHMVMRSGIHDHDVSQDLVLAIAREVADAVDQLPWAGEVREWCVGLSLFSLVSADPVRWGERAGQRWSCLGSWRLGENTHHTKREKAKIFSDFQMMSRHRGSTPVAATPPVTRVEEGSRRIPDLMGGAC